MSRYYSFRPYVPVAERRKKAEAASKKIATKSGRALTPVCLTGRKIASTFWGKAWCDNLESYSDYENRLPRGRTYVRNGSVIDLHISGGKVQALVQGSSLYKIAINFKALSPERWIEFKQRNAGKVTNLLDLLMGRLPKDILAEITARKTGLFPSPKEIDLGCSCPDWAEMCKHVAAVLYGVGARLDEKPELFFTLRGVDMQELLTAASTAAVEPIVGISSSPVLADSDLAEIFGVEVELTPPAPAAKVKPAPTKKSYLESPPPRTAKLKPRKAPAKSQKQKAKKNTLR